MAKLIKRALIVIPHVSLILATPPSRSPLLEEALDTSRYSTDKNDQNRHTLHLSQVYSTFAHSQSEKGSGISDPELEILDGNRRLEGLKRPWLVRPREEEGNKVSDLKKQKYNKHYGLCGKDYDTVQHFGSFGPISKSQEYERTSALNFVKSDHACRQSKLEDQTFISCNSGSESSHKLTFYPSSRNFPCGIQNSGQNTLKNISEYYPNQSSSNEGQIVRGVNLKEIDPIVWAWIPAFWSQADKAIINESSECYWNQKV
ncbi:hypothetical protein PGTUg99_015122 [Puccinia graminis f. sp. tritici]|uniref:Uncharacterized protein n=1 Tax=Puccinia graminis f. sp. tritici TaxID=56615 RepID=A0A5B0SJ98_PUCGR|nr:hypothetical protein PGTUg99_015122 [Puccinia graminis f. sp. tritici]